MFADTFMLTFTSLELRFGKKTAFPLIVMIDKKNWCVCVCELFIIMNGCPTFKGLNAAHHNRIVDLIAKELRCATGEQTQFHINKTVQADWFRLNLTTLIILLKALLTLQTSL